ncbi:hypothetical protein [Pseudomonas coronafaciens]
MRRAGFAAIRCLGR